MSCVIVNLYGTVFASVSWELAPNPLSQHPPKKKNPYHHTLKCGIFILRGQIFSCWHVTDTEAQCGWRGRMVSCDSSAAVVLFWDVWWVRMAMRGERTHRSDVLCGRWRIKQRQRRENYTSVAAARVASTHIREDNEDVRIPLPRSDFNFIMRGKQKTQICHQLFSWL